MPETASSSDMVTDEGFYLQQKLDKKNIPVWCNIRGSSLVACSRVKATYVLAHVLGEEQSKNLSKQVGYQCVCINRSNFLTMTVPCENVLLCYVKVRAESATAPPLIKRCLSAMYSMVDQYVFNDHSGMHYLRKTFNVDRNVLKHMKDVKPPHHGEFDRSKVTAEHHTHYRPEEVWELLEKNKASKRAALMILSRLRGVDGVTEAAVATFMMYVLFCRPQCAYFLATSRRLWECKDVGQLSKVLKEISTPMKSMHNREVCDYTELFELQVLVNRGTGKVDWEAEREHRTKPDVIRISPQRVYDEAVKVFRMGIRYGYRYKSMKLDEYIRSRWEWVPTGSVHSQYNEDSKYICKEYRHRSKFVALNMMPAEHIAGMMRRKPMIKAWASVKYEWAKQRAIYGVDLTSTVITNFAMFGCERVLKHKFPVGEDAAATRVHKRLSMMLRDHESYCYDFDDFNAQHSIESMMSVLAAYRDVFKSAMTDEQVEAMEWVVKSVKEMIVVNNEEGRCEEYKLGGTLLSGWRLTTFMNTVLNYIYFTASGAFEQPGVVDSVHNGDDVLLSIKNLKAAVNVHCVMAKMNARAQAAKCNVYSLGEFLRVEHKIDKENGLGAQYLSRSMATLVHSRTESQAPVQIVEAVKAMVTRCEEAAQRSVTGAEAAAHALEMACDRIAEVFGKTKKEVRVIARSHVLVGGALASKSACIDWLVEERVLYDEPSEEEAREKGEATVSMLMPGIQDYGRTLARMYSEFIHHDDVYGAIVRATKRQLAVTRETRLQMTDVSSDAKYKFGRELFREYRGLIEIPHLEKARFVGISPISMLGHRETQKIKHLIEGAKDVQYVLSVLL